MRAFVHLRTHEYSYETTKQTSATSLPWDGRGWRWTCHRHSMEHPLPPPRLPPTPHLLFSRAGVEIIIIFKGCPLWGPLCQVRKVVVVVLRSVGVGRYADCQVLRPTDDPNAHTHYLCLNYHQHLPKKVKGPFQKLWVCKQCTYVCKWLSNSWNYYSFEKSCPTCDLYFPLCVTYVHYRFACFLTSFLPFMPFLNAVIDGTSVCILFTHQHISYVYSGMGFNHN